MGSAENLRCSHPLKNMESSFEMAPEAKINGFGFRKIEKEKC